MPEDEEKLFKTCAIPFSSIETKFVCVIGDNYDHSKKKTLKSHGPMVQFMLN